MKDSPKQQSPALPELLQGRRQLAEDETFRFSCHDGLSCFKTCCADVNIFLTPVDVLQLSRKLGLTTTEFLDQHALNPITKDLNLPVVLLKMESEPKKACPFVGDQGCTVYHERPWSCRMYPVGSALPPAKVGVDAKPVYFLFEDDFCKGHGEGQEWTIADWRKDQGADQREELEAGFNEIVSHPWFIGGRQLDARRMDMFYTGCYDLDAFRRFVFDTTFLTRFELPEDQIEKIRNSDDELMRFSYQWLRYALFSEPTIKVSKEAEQKATKKAEAMAAARQKNKESEENKES